MCILFMFFFLIILLSLFSFFFFFNDPPPTEISPLPLPAALPICGVATAVPTAAAWLLPAFKAIWVAAPAAPVAANATGLPVRPVAVAVSEFGPAVVLRDRKSTRLNSSHSQISYAVFCLKKKKKTT